MTPKQFAKYLARDHGCYHCGTDDDTCIPQHRQNRGMGGSKSRDVPSNIVVLCSRINGLIESDAWWASEARIQGWKLNSWDDPLEVPIRDSAGVLWLLDDKFGRTAC
jgi:hypothetical protein